MSSRIIRIINSDSIAHTWVGKAFGVDREYDIPANDVQFWIAGEDIIQAIQDGYAVISDGYQEFAPSRGISYLNGDSDSAEIEDDDLFGTTNTSYETSIMLSVSALSYGKYKISWSFEALSDVANVVHDYMICADDGYSVHSLSSIEFTDVNIVPLVSGFFVGYLWGSYKVELCVKSYDGLSEVQIRRRRLELRRVE